MREPSDIQVTYDGVDITGSVRFATARFEAQGNAGVGTFSFDVRDRDRTLAFTTGKEVILSLDGQPYFGGYLMQRGQTYAFPVVNTTAPVTGRIHRLTGVNFNALFDRLVARNTANYTERLPPEPGTSTAGYLVKKLASSYLDLPAGMNTTTYVDNVGRADPHATQFAFESQGEPWRKHLERISLYNGAIYYIDASKNLHYHAPETLFSRWGFSDQPNRLAITSSTGYQGATYGFRELEATEDITSIINDVFVWGGSPIRAMLDSDDGTFFARRTNATTVAAYGRWQAAEPRFGELGSQGEVDARAEAIVPPPGTDLPPGVDPVDGVIRNRSKPNNTVRLSWFAHDVPKLSGVREHLVPGDVVTISLYTFDTGSGPLILTLPLRRVTISFPTLPSAEGGTPQTFARFDGEFGLSLNDPYNLWEAILNRQTFINRAINSIGSPTVEGEPGAMWQGTPDEDADSTTTVFTLSSLTVPITYVSGSSNVYLNGVRKTRNVDYTEQPTAGTITMTSAPSTGADFWVIVTLAG